jgi:hypothetical protein
MLSRRWAASGYPLSKSSVPGVAINPRFRRRLARFDTARNLIELRTDVAKWPPNRRSNVLTHELAHVAVFRRHGTAVAPHGPEWRHLMELAGVEASLSGLVGCGPWSSPERRLGPAARKTTSRRALRQRFEHRCPVCQMVRLANRPVARWRCSDCVAAGLEGRLAITAIPRE